MTILLKQVRLLGPGSTPTRTNILLADGKLAYRGADEPTADQVWDCSAYTLSPGWVDLRARSGEPGHENKETLASLRASAIFGGFTHLGILPETQPVLQTRDMVQFFRSASQGQAVQFWPYGAVSLGLKGEKMAEMVDLFQAGACAFSDGSHPVWNADLFLKTLQYLGPLGALLIDRAEDPQLAQYGQMHEGLEATLLGLKGIPPLAEEIALERNLKILAYTGGRLHISCISTAQGVALIKKAKSEGLAVTADVAIHNLVYTDAIIRESDFDTQYKVSPPLRDESHRQALLQGLLEGTIDAICSDHTPLHIEDKLCEFDMASPGISSLPTVYALTRQLNLDETTVVRALSTAPRTILGLSQPQFELGEQADYTLFAPESSYAYTLDNHPGKSRNTPELGRTLQGQVVATFLGQAVGQVQSIKA